LNCYFYIYFFIWIIGKVKKCIFIFIGSLDLALKGMRIRIYGVNIHRYIDQCPCRNISASARLTKKEQNQLTLDNLLGGSKQTGLLFCSEYVQCNNTERKT